MLLNSPVLLKRLMCLSALFICGSSLTAQPVITESNLPNSSTKQLMHTALSTEVDPGSASEEAQVWDFSHLEPESTELVQFESAETIIANSASISSDDIGRVAPLRELLDLHLVALLQEFGFLLDHNREESVKGHQSYDINSGCVEGNNIFSAIGAQSHDDQDLKYMILSEYLAASAINYGQTIVKESMLAFFFYPESPITQYFVSNKMEVSLSADAHGTLVLPSGEKEVLRVTHRTVHNFRVSKNSGEEVRDSTFTTVAYKFYSPENRYPVLIINTVPNSEGKQITRVQYEGVAQDVAGQESAFFVPKQCCYAVQFDNQSELLTYYEWDFGDGNTGTGTHPRHVYDELGTYFVTLTGYDLEGYPQSYSSRVNVECIPVPDFIYRTSCKRVEFGNLTKNGQTYLWTFNNSVRTDENPIIDEVEFGEFEVTLEATSPSGDVASITKSYLVDCAPVAGFDYRNEITSCGIVEYIDTSLHADEVLYRCGEGHLVTEDTHIYNKCGYYDVTQIVTSESGLKDSITRTITAQCPFVADFTIIPDSVNCRKFRFRSDCPLETANWDFGDGTTGEGALVSHEFETDGVYEVSVVSVAINTHTDTSTQLLQISCDPNTEEPITLMLHPESAQLFVSHNEDDPSDLHLVIYNTAGQLVLDQLLSGEQSQHIIPADNWALGCYVFQVSGATDGQVQTGTVAIVR